MGSSLAVSEAFFERSEREKQQTTKGGNGAARVAFFERSGRG
jgi:hypothetical protein